LSVLKPQTPGLVDALGAGYAVIHRRPWVLAISVALSTLLWLGPTITLGLPLDRLLPEGGDRQLLTQILASDLRLGLAWLNVVPVLPAPAGRPTAVTIGEPLALLGWLVLINLLALACSSLFLTALGAGVRNDRLWPLAYLRRAGRAAYHIGLALGMLLGVGLVLGLPFLAISAIVIAALPAATTVIALLWYVAFFWAYVYTGFAPEAIVIGQVGPLRAIYQSVNIVRHDLLGTIGLLLLSLLIASGLGVIWRQLSTTPVGLPLAILGSAYIGSGLSAARLEFYRARATRWS
jgi:uncharacterized membrane protein YciS (DUF1049 family)